jgi:hypothetical protein
MRFELHEVVPCGGDGDCPGDFDGSGDVNVSDLLTVRLLSSGADTPQAN